MAKLIKGYSVAVDDENRQRIPISGIKKDVSPTEMYENNDFEKNSADKKSDENTKNPNENLKYNNDIYKYENNKAEEIINNAKLTSEIIINNALDNARNELVNAVSAGYSEGFESGKTEAMQVIDSSLKKIKTLMDSINKMQDNMISEFKDSMFRIISEITRKIIHIEINQNDNYLAELFSDAISDITTEEFITITVAESEIGIATRNLSQVVSQVQNVKDFKIVSDKNSSKGTMIVETSKGIVDASLDGQLEKIDYMLELMKNNLYNQDMQENTSIMHFEENQSALIDEDPDNSDNTEDINYGENFANYFDNSQFMPVDIEV